MPLLGNGLDIQLLKALEVFRRIHVEFPSGQRNRQHSIVLQQFPCAGVALQLLQCVECKFREKGWNSAPLPVVGRDHVFAL